MKIKKLGALLVSAALCLLLPMAVSLWRKWNSLS